MLPLAIDLSASGPTFAQRVVGLSLVAAFFIILSIVRYRFQYAGLPEEQRRQKRALQGQREDQDPETVRVTPADDIDAIRSQVHALFDSTDDPVLEEPPSPMDAVGEVRAALALSYRDLTAGIPRLSLGMLYEAAIILVFGSVAVFPTAYFVALFARGDGASLEWLIDEALEVSETVATIPVDLLSSFPYAQELYGLGLALVIQAGTVLYETPTATAALLLVGAIAIWYLERETGGVETTLFDSHLAMGVAGVGLGLVVWLGGVLPATIGRFVGFPKAGAIVGFLFATLLFLVAIAEIGVGLKDQLVALATEELGRTATAYLVIRRLSAGFALVMAPFAALYMVISIANGKLGGAVGAFLSGSFTIRVVVGVALLLLFAGIIKQTRDAWPDVRAALRETLARKAVRVALFKRAVPFGILVFAYFLAVALGLNAILAGVVAVLSAIVARLLFVAFQRVKYRASLIESDRRTASRVIIHAYEFQTADGETVYYAVANTNELAHTDQDQLVDAVIDATVDLFEEGESSPSVAGQFATDLLEFGIVDVGDTKKKLAREAEETVEHELRSNNGQVEIETLHDKFDRVPEQIWRRRVQNQLRRGQLRRRNGYYLTA